MIQGMTIRGTASYDAASGIPLVQLRAVNFFYGSNGVGKTTISRLIAEPSAPSHALCTIAWAGGIELQRLVYNRDFVSSNFEGNIKGIFTLGEKSIENEEKLRLTRLAADGCRTEWQNLQNTLGGEDGSGGKLGDKQKLGVKFLGQCWSAKTKHDDKFAKAFEPNRGSKERFKDRVLHEVANNKGTTTTYEELERRARSLYVSEPHAISRPHIPDGARILALNRDPLLVKAIVGKGDVDVAALIKRLAISDWVRQGLAYYDPDDQTCPFCQEKAPESLSDRLNEYFDEAYTAEVIRLKRIRDDFSSERQALLMSFDSIGAAEYSQVDYAVLDVALSALFSKVNLNLEKIEQKVREPSIRCELESLDDALESVLAIVRSADEKMEEHNRLVESYKVECKQLHADVWRYMIDVELEAVITQHQDQIKSLNAAIQALEGKIQSQKEQLQAKERTIQELERTTTSVQPTVDAINGLLRSFGFSGFSLGATGDGNYKLVRIDGTDAKENLSEGERSFVTFLYFYHLVKGSHEGGNGASALVVVFDDPVSSLDSDVLFIVSTLVRSIVEEAKAGNGRVKQVFVLTHNVYFHKEVTYNRSRGGNVLSHESFWMVRKPDGTSQIERQSKNPIETSYQLLWSEVRSANDNTANIQNTLRRILENYFKILGGIDLGELVDHFEGTDKLICKSLTSWLHDGSHSVHDDVCVALSDSQVHAYLDIFEKIFVRTEHHSHYRMMMGIAPPEHVRLLQPVAE